MGRLLRENAVVQLIAHRGLMNGPDPERENHPDQIRAALDAGFDAEVDVRYADGRWWLGHDLPQYEVGVEFIRNECLWVHCKNIEALAEINWVSHHTNYFWHQSDDYTLTSRGFIWAYPGKPLTAYSICVMPEWQDTWRDALPRNVWGICSDYVTEIEVILNEHRSRKTLPVARQSRASQ